MNQNRVTYKKFRLLIFFHNLRNIDWGTIILPTTSTKDAHVLIPINIPFHCKGELKLLISR